MLGSARVLAALATSASLLVATPALAQPPAKWLLEQNDPNPFCPQEETTALRFEAPQQAYVRLEIRDPGDTEVIRTLLDTNIEGGFYLVEWDGRNDAGDVVADGSYPCRLTVEEPPILELEILIDVSCEPVPTERGSWGRIKSLYLSAPG